jgi:hypothetical protein
MLYPDSNPKYRLEESESILISLDTAPEEDKILITLALIINCPRELESIDDVIALVEYRATEAVPIMLFDTYRLLGKNTLAVVSRVIE